MPSANHAAACRRTSSRLVRPQADQATTIGISHDPAVAPPPAEVTTTRRSDYHANTDNSTSVARATDRAAATGRPIWGDKRTEETASARVRPLISVCGAGISASSSRQSAGDVLALRPSQFGRGTQPTLVREAFIRKVAITGSSEHAMLTPNAS